MILEELNEKLGAIEEENTYLYFITRVLKPEVKKSSKLLEKFLFKVYQVDVNQEIRTYLYNLTINQLKYLSKKKSELKEYDVISDDTDQLFTYQMTNKTMSFHDVIYNQLASSSPPKILSLSEIIMEEELWAYCVGFYYGPKDWIYTFRKITSGKVAVDEKDGVSKNKAGKTLRTIFNTNNQKLELLHGETVNLDKQVDCIFHNEVFYVAKKMQFEQIIGLLEEFKERAKEIADKLIATKMILGADVIKSKIDELPSIHKKLIKLSKIGNYELLNVEVVKTMEKICSQYGENLKTKDGKLLIENDKDIELALKMLSDYYKIGEVSGKAYGTFAGKQIDVK